MYRIGSVAIAFPTLRVVFPTGPQNPRTGCVFPGRPHGRVVRWSLFTAGVAAATLLPGASLPGDAPSPGVTLRVSHFPTAGYLGEPLTFVLNASPGKPVRVNLNRTLLMECAPETGNTQVVLSLDRSGLLSFCQGTNTISFDVVRPSDPTAFREEAGYLYTDRGPAILLATHRVPPRHDRTWEVLRLLRRLLTDTRPIVTQGILIGVANLLRPLEPYRTAGLSSFWRMHAVTNSLSEIHALLGGASGGLRKADVALVALAGYDLDMGMHPLEFRMKLEWYLERLARAGIPWRFLAFPTLDARRRIRYAATLEAVKTAARSHHALLLDSPPRAGTCAPSLWLPALETQIGSRLRLRP